MGDYAELMDAVFAAAEYMSVDDLKHTIDSVDVGMLTEPEFTEETQQEWFGGPIRQALLLEVCYKMPSAEV